MKYAILFVLGSLTINVSALPNPRAVDIWDVRPAASQSQQMGEDEGAYALGGAGSDGDVERAQSGELEDVRGGECGSAFFGDDGPDF